MPKSAYSALALSLALSLGAPTAALAATTERPVYRHSAPPPRAHAMSHRERMKIEGLSRNPNNCVKYGCVGNN